MKTIRLIILPIIVASCASCASNEELQQRMDQRNERAASFNERREIRTNARQQRTDMWFERHMN